MAIGYMLAMSLVMGGLFGFINSAQQVFVDVFDAELLFPAIFAMIAMFMALSSMLNARIVGRLGTRRVSHSALFGYIALAIVHSKSEARRVGNECVSQVRYRRSPYH